MSTLQYGAGMHTWTKADTRMMMAGRQNWMYKKPEKE